MLLAIFDFLNGIEDNFSMKLLFDFKIFYQGLHINIIELLTINFVLFKNFHNLLGQLHLVFKPIYDILNAPILVPFALKVLILCNWLNFLGLNRSWVVVSWLKEVDVPGSKKVLIGIFMSELSLK